MQALTPGDVIEIETPHGLAYLQVTHLHSVYPNVVRAISGLHQKRPDELAALAQAPTAFTGLIPIAEMLRSQALRGAHVGHAPVPEADSQFPTFSTPIRDRNGDIVYWWYWNGSALSYEVDKQPKAANRPRREVIGAKDLMRRLAGLAENN
ncbi:MAG: hypothetical protein JJT95_05250 [Pararhodobacter sp.]|nr:hypothetical protein [Pararhodobacter sp.]